MAVNNPQKKIKKQLPLSIALGSSFGVWLVAALVHQWILR